MAIHRSWLIHIKHKYCLFLFLLLI
uniref:Uncharacterized protein n=1 Tax=Arundo donax TaxID=35708 RepID=A0A0A9F5F1_ARUDO